MLGKPGILTQQVKPSFVMVESQIGALIQDLGSWLSLDQTLGILAIWGEDQCMEDFFVSPSLQFCISKFKNK